jgi:hypothetical protein
VFDPHHRVQRVAVKFDAMEMPANRKDDGTWHALVPEGATSASAVLETSEAVLFRSLKVSLTELPLPVEERIAQKPSLVTKERVLIVGGAAVGVAVIVAIIAGVAVSQKRIDGSLGRIELP